MKGDNILVESTGNCKISDFGIAKRTNELQPSTFTGMQGTLFWMAPEAANTKEEGYTSKVDVWGVGCVMLEMWTGQHPWHGHGTMAVMRMVRWLRLMSQNAADVVPAVQRRVRTTRPRTR
jgi:serine/threonine protein kinase